MASSPSSSQKQRRPASSVRSPSVESSEELVLDTLKSNSKEDAFFISRIDFSHDDDDASTHTRNLQLIISLDTSTQQSCNVTYSESLKFLCTERTRCILFPPLTAISMVTPSITVEGELSNAGLCLTKVDDTTIFSLARQRQIWQVARDTEPFNVIVRKGVFINGGVELCRSKKTAVCVMETWWDDNDKDTKSNYGTLHWFAWPPKGVYFQSIYPSPAYSFSSEPYLLVSSEKPIEQQVLKINYSLDNCVDADACLLAQLKADAGAFTLATMRRNFFVVNRSMTNFDRINSVTIVDTFSDESDSSFHYLQRSAYESAAAAPRSRSIAQVQEADSSSSSELAPAYDAPSTIASPPSSAQEKYYSQYETLLYKHEDIVNLPSMGQLQLIDPRQYTVGAELVFIIDNLAPLGESVILPSIFFSRKDMDAVATRNTKIRMSVEGLAATPITYLIDWYKDEDLDPEKTYLRKSLRAVDKQHLRVVSASQSRELGGRSTSHLLVTNLYQLPIVLAIACQQGVPNACADVSVPSGQSIQSVSSTTWATSTRPSIFKVFKVRPGRNAELDASFY